MEISLPEFFEKKGTVELFCEIDEKGERFSDLRELVSISHDTLSVRLGQAENLNLLEKEPVKNSQGGGHLWTLTHAGLRIHEKLEEQNVVRHYEVYRMSRKEFQEHEESFIEWTKENDDQIIDWKRWDTSTTVYGKPDDLEPYDPSEE